MAKFITFEGIEGVGKSGAVTYVASLLRARDIPYVMTREPGGTPLAEEIRHVLLHPTSHEVMSSATELLLMFASRAQHVAALIQPSLTAERYVLCDRLTDSSYAYQGGGRGVAEHRIAELENWVGLSPDITILLDAPVEIAMQRAASRSAPDRIEREKQAFFERVRQAFLARADKFPERFRVIDASKPLLAVQAQLQCVVTDMLS